MRKSPPLGLYKKIATVFIAITAALVVFIFYYSLTYAFVSITPKVVKVTFPFNFLVTESVAGVDPEKGVFEGMLISQEISGEKTVQSSGTAIVKSNVTGTVKIINTWSKRQTLVKTTRLLTEKNELFRLSETVVVPAGQSVEVSVYQDNTSQTLSVEIGQKLTIPGLSDDLQVLIYAVAVSNFGGVEQTVTVLTKENVEKATQDLLRELGEQITKTVPIGSMIILKPEIIEQTVSAAIGDQVASATIALKVQYNGAVMKRSEAETFATNILLNGLSQDMEIANTESITITYGLEKIDLPNQVAQITGSVSADTIIRKDSQILSKKKLIRLSGEEATTYLEHLPEIEDATINFFPFWVKNMPSFEDHIIIEVKS